MTTPNRDASPDAGRVLIFDTTLRDGEQSPGCSMTLPEKLRVGRALADLGVDIIEAGFPVASKGDWESVNTIAREVQGPVIAGLARCNREDIELAWKAVRDAAKPRIHVFLATSAIHREYKLNMAKEEIIRAAVGGVRVARDLCADVEFSTEDASRTELEFLAEVVEAVIEAGATTINVPDTVGYAVPEEYGEIFRYLRKHVRGADRATFSVHCHNDLGMAVANSLAGVMGGARQVECTINGIGERAGNCSLEEIVMAMQVRKEFYNLHTGIQSQKLYPTSRLVSSITGMPIPRNKAIIGENAFAHESGIHQHGVLKHASTYEIMRPQDVGLSRNSLVLGKHSGRAAFRERVKELGFDLPEGELNSVFEDFKALADTKKELFDGDIEALVLRRDAHGNNQVPQVWSIGALWTSATSGAAASAVARLTHADGRSVEQGATGDGPIDATFKAIELATGVAVKLVKFELRSVSEGEDAQGEAVVTVESNQRSYRGSSLSTNIIESSARAFLDVINQVEASRNASLQGGRTLPTQAPVPAAV
jgi:2-isopropylmalate synthase